jgi:thiol-disulfide isomerase/thioredoxin
MKSKSLVFLAVFFIVFQLDTTKGKSCFIPVINNKQTKGDKTRGGIGLMALNFETKDINGKLLNLQSFRGKYVLLDFWASWCVPCRKSNPNLIILYHKYSTKGFDIIGIADDDQRQLQWKNAVKQDSTNLFHQVLRGVAVNTDKTNAVNPGDLHQLYNIQSLPVKILINPAGKIIGRYGDNDKTDDDLDQALAAIFKN